MLRPGGLLIMFGMLLFPTVEDQQAIVFPNGTVHRLSAAQTTFVSEGTLPEGGTWSLMPMPPTLLGPW